MYQFYKTARVIFHQLFEITIFSFIYFKDYYFQLSEVLGSNLIER